MITSNIKTANAYLKEIKRIKKINFKILEKQYLNIHSIAISQYIIK